MLSVFSCLEPGKEAASQRGRGRQRGRRKSGRELRKKRGSAVRVTGSTTRCTEDRGSDLREISCHPHCSLE